MKKPNILFLGMDSLAARNMSLYGYHRLTTPHMDKYLSTDSIVCNNAFSPSIPTPPGYSSLFTGMDVFGTEVVALRHKGEMTPKVRSIPEILKDQGYNTTCVGFTGNPVARGFDKYIDFPNWGSWEEGRSHKAEEMNKVALPEMERLQKEGKPWLLFLRHMDPHSPYLPPQPYDRMFFQGDEFDKNNKSLDKVYDFKPFRDYFYTWFPPHCTSADYIIAQYDGAVAYMDACITHLLEKLVDLNIEEETIVIFTADHGETLMDHDCYFDHHGLYDCTLRIPLAIRWKGNIKQTTVEDICQQKDLMPTLMELMGWDPGIQFDGRSLVPLMKGEHREPEPEMYVTECTWQRKHGWRTPEWKLIVALEPDFHYKEPKELYNLIKDPEETVNVIDQHPEIAAALETRLNNHVAKREKEKGIVAPIIATTDWYRDEGPFKSSDEAFNTQHIGDPEAARKLQQKD